MYSVSHYTCNTCNERMFFFLISNDFDKDFSYITGMTSGKNMKQISVPSDLPLVHN